MQGRTGDVVAAAGERVADRNGLIEHVALVGAGVGRDVLVYDGDFHVF